MGIPDVFECLSCNGFWFHVQPSSQALCSHLSSARAWSGKC